MGALLQDYRTDEEEFADSVGEPDIADLLFGWLHGAVLALTGISVAVLWWPRRRWQTWRGQRADALRQEFAACIAYDEQARRLSDKQLINELVTLRADELDEAGACYLRELADRYQMGATGPDATQHIYFNDFHRDGAPARYEAVIVERACGVPVLLFADGGRAVYLTPHAAVRLREEIDRLLNHVSGVPHG